MSKKIVFFISIVVLALLFHLTFKDEERVLDYKEGPEYHIDLVDPEMAGGKVMHGFRIMQQTLKYAPKYAGDKISCNSCHFNGGNTLGGKNNGISLVGVSKKYPLFSKRAGKKIDLAERISNCFERSMDGNPAPADSEEIQSLIAYLNWISTPVKESKNMPWLGLKPLSIKYIGSEDKGRKLYNQHCSLCHGVNGEGGFTEEENPVPPLWGDSAFNDAAGMNREDIFASFIYWNMPFGQPFLTESQAIDIAAYVTKRPRPHFVPPNKK